jgi:hypothetical protein
VFLANKIGDLWITQKDWFSKQKGNEVLTSVDGTVILLERQNSNDKDRNMRHTREIGIEIGIEVMSNYKLEKARTCYICSPLVEENKKLLARLTTLEQLLQNIIYASRGHYADVDVEAALKMAITKADEFLNT